MLLLRVKQIKSENITNASLVVGEGKTLRCPWSTSLKRVGPGANGGGGRGRRGEGHLHPRRVFADLRRYGCPFVVHIWSTCGFWARKWHSF
jgi:hypothetical protein